MSSISFTRECQNFKRLFDEAGGYFIPGRVLSALYFNLSLLDLQTIEKLCIEDKSWCRRAKGGIAYGLHRLLSESDRAGTELLVKFIKTYNDKLIEFLGKVPETAGLLFPASQNIEPYRDYLKHNLKFEPVNLTKFILRTAKTVEKNVVDNENMDPDDRAYAALHLSRAYAEVARTIYSMREKLEPGIKGDFFECKGDLVRCIIDKALELADRRITGASNPGIPMLGYIQITSTVTRTNLWRDKNLLERVGGVGIEEAKKIIDSSSFTTLAKFEALSLEGSYHYNKGWYYAVKGDFNMAADHFRKGYESFAKLERNGKKLPLGFFRGVYVSLWNYYLMSFDADLVKGNEISSDKIEDAICWGRGLEKILEEQGAHIMYKVGIHGLYSYALAIVLSHYYNLPFEPRQNIVEMFPGNIAYTVEVASKLVKGERIDGELLERANLKKIIREIIVKIDESDSNYFESLLNNINNIEKFDLTVREIPIIKRISEDGAKGNWSQARRLAALLTVYTL